MIPSKKIILLKKRRKFKARGFGTFSLLLSFGLFSLLSLSLAAIFRTELRELEAVKALVKKDIVQYRLENIFLNILGPVKKWDGAGSTKRDPRDLWSDSREKVSVDVLDGGSRLQVGEEIYFLDQGNIVGKKGFARNVLWKAGDEKARIEFLSFSKSTGVLTIQIGLLDDENRSSKTLKYLLAD